MNGPESTHERSRRAFLARLAVAVAAPAALSGCRRDATIPPQPTGRTSTATIEIPRREVEAASPPRLPAAEPVVRVCIREVREPGGAVAVGPDDKWLRVGPEDDFDRAVVLRGPVQVRLNSSAGGGWSVVDALGFTWSLEASRTLQLTALKGEDAVLHIEQQRYPGFLRLVPRTDAAEGAFDVVNHVAVESYLPGVLAREIFSQWHDRTHMAQAIAARSYACAQQQAYAGRHHFDLTNTQSSQAYSGATSIGRCNQAVATTRGQVLAYQQLLVPAYYSSCCGGVAASAADAIGPATINAIPPLQGRRGQDVCTAAPVFRWTARQPRPLATQRLNVFGQRENLKALAGIGSLTKLEVAARNAHGRPSRYKLTDSRGSAVEVPAETLRQALNYAPPNLPAPGQLLKSSNLRADIQASSVTFSGQGYGHGVGLCQYGAQALAKDGMSHESILAWYYPGAAIVQTYS